MSSVGVPVQLTNQTFDFAILWAIKGFWKDYKPVFSLAQLGASLKENEKLWLESKQVNFNITTYRATLQLSLNHHLQHAGIAIHRNLVPHLYELVDYTAFQQYEKELVEAIFPQLIEIKLSEQSILPFMSERSYQLWLFKKHSKQALSYSVKSILDNRDPQSPCMKLQLLTEPQLDYLVKKAIRQNLIPLPDISTRPF